MMVYSELCIQETNILYDRLGQKPVLTRNTNDSYLVTFVLLSSYCFCTWKSSVDYNLLDTISNEFIVRLILS